MASSGVAGQVFIEIVAKDKLNLNNVGKGAGSAGSTAGKQYASSFSTALNGLADQLKGIISDATYSFRDPFIGLRSMAARAGNVCAAEFSRAFNMANKRISTMSENKDMINNNMVNRTPGWAKAQSRIGNAPYYLQSAWNQSAMRMNPFNFWSNYGTGNAAIAFKDIAGFGKEFRRRFRTGMDTANWTNSGMSLTQALRNNLRAFGTERNPFQYYGGKGASMLSQGLNQTLVKPNMAGLVTNNVMNKLAGKYQSMQGLANTLPGLVNAGVNVMGAAMPVMIQGASSAFIVSLSQAFMGLFGLGGIAKGALTTYGDFQQSAMRFKVLQTGITDRDYKAVINKVKDTASSLPLVKTGELMKAVEVGQRGGILNNYRLNKDITPMTDFIDFIGKASSAFKTQGYNPESIATDVIRVGNIFKIGPENYKKILNQLLNATMLSTSNLPDMISYLKLQGTQFNSRGLTIEEALAEYVSQVNQTGLVGPVLATLNRSMERGEQSKVNVFSDLGIALVDQYGNQRVQEEIVNDLNNVLQKLIPNLSVGQRGFVAGSFFNQYAARGAIIDDPKEYWKNLALITTSDADMLDKYADVAAQGVTGVTGRVSSMWDAMNIQMGEILGPTFESAGKTFIESFKKFGEKLKGRMKEFADQIEKDLKNGGLEKTFDNIGNLFDTILSSGKDMLPTLESLISKLPEIADAFASFNAAVIEFMNNDVIKKVLDTFSSKRIYDDAKLKKEVGLFGDKKKTEEAIAGGKKTKSDYIGNKAGQIGAAGGWTEFANFKSVELSNAKNPFNYFNPLYAPLKATGKFITNMWDSEQEKMNNVSKAFTQEDIANKVKSMKDTRFHNKYLNKDYVYIDPNKQYFAPTFDPEHVPEELRESGYIKAPNRTAPKGFDPFMYLAGTKRQLEHWVPDLWAAYYKRMEGDWNNAQPLKLFDVNAIAKDWTNIGGDPMLDILGGLNNTRINNVEEALKSSGYADFADAKFLEQFINPTPTKELWNAKKAENKLGSLITGNNPFFNIPQEGVKSLREWRDSKDRVSYNEKAFRDMAKQKFADTGLDFTDNALTTDIFGRDLKFMFEKDKNGIPAVYNMAKNVAEQVIESFISGFTDTAGESAQDIADDYGIDSLQYYAYQRGDLRKNRIDADTIRQTKKEAKTKTQADRIALEQKKIERAENKAQRKYQLELDKRNKDMEKWRTEAENEFNFRVQQAQEARAQEVSGALGSLKNVIGSNWGYLSNAEVQKAMVYYDPTKSMKAGDIIEMQQKYGTADPRKAAKMQSIMNMQDLANAKAFQEQMWYEYLDAVAQGGTTNEINIDNGAIVFNIPKLDSIKIEKSQVSIMAEKVEAFLDEEIKDDIKAIREYCDEQGNPISV